MDKRTREYLKERFAEYYKAEPPSEPDGAIGREYAYIPWSSDPNPPMIRHRSHFDMEPLGETIAKKSPRHVYYSSALYDDPAADSMNEKGWRGADLVFDLDADHFDDVDPSTDTLTEMLHRCQDETAHLIELLTTDLGFNDLSIVFSGRRGFHVHVRDPEIKSFEKGERREIVDYVTAAGLEGEDVIRETTVSGDLGQKSPAKRRYVEVEGGWGRRKWLSFLDYVDELLAEDEDVATDRLEEFDGIGEKRADSALSALRKRRDEAQTARHHDNEGGLLAHPAVHSVFKRYVASGAESTGADIDEPVTTDSRRLMRLPGSLHGGSGLMTCTVPREDFDSFDPPTDAVPSHFRDAGSVSVSLSDDVTTAITGEKQTLDAGTHEVEAYVAIHLMASGKATLEG